MTFGEQIRELRQAKTLTQRDLGSMVGVEFSYISKIENGKLDFGDYPSETLIVKLAEALHADPDELLLLAKKIPPQIRQRVMERPEVFRKIATLDDQALDDLAAVIDRNGNSKRGKSR